MKAVVTGSGCLSTNLVEALKARGGWEVTCLHRHGSHGIGLANYNIPVDSSSEHDLRDAIDPCTDAVFHVAANTSIWTKHHNDLYRDNIEFTANLLKACDRRMIGRFVHTSTAGVHDSVGTVYTTTKRRAETLVSNSGLDAIILQPCIIVGRHDRKNYARLFQKLPRFAPPGRIPFGDARSIAEAHIAAFNRGKSGATYLLGGPNHTWLEFFKAIAEVTGQKPPIGTLPRWAMRCLCAWESIKSRLFDQSPLITWPMARLMMQESRVPESMEIKASILDYQPKSLHEMVRDCWDYMNAPKDHDHEATFLSQAAGH